MKPICSIKNSEIVGNYINGPNGTLITSETLIEELKNVILGFWTNRKNNHFPGPLPVSLERKSMYKLKQYPYLVCFKSDGIRFMMLCYNKCIYMVDRSFTFYKVEQSFTDIFNGHTEINKCSALFDGELVINKNGKWAYIIYDCVCINYTDVSQETFYNRYNHLKQFITN